MEKKGVKKTTSGNKSDKLGLALSGGGFRASFFHIGVLAQMAILGLLRHVEVISTVSGGSIIGALYYCYLKKRLEETYDADIKDEDYIDIIKEMEEHFLKVVQLNLRMRTFVNPWKNIKMSKANYSRSDRIGELYDEHLYRPVLKPCSGKMVEMRELRIDPKPKIKNFHPRDHNQNRQAKVPILLINATTLNTGHNWRFEATKMGESDRKSAVFEEIDKNMRLVRISSYDDIIKKHQNIELGLAVAASACVPGIFHPLAISDLYKSKEGPVRVQLVDGGVHDNQGVQGLIDEKCNLFVISDASGQLKDEMEPVTSIISVLLRSNNIMMDRIREEQLTCHMETYKDSVALMHLRKGLAVEDVPWINKNKKPGKIVRKTKMLLATQFGIDPEVQKLLACFRTDLDSFTDVEAFSLMLDSYLMTEKELGKTKKILDLRGNKKPKQTPNETWNFMGIEEWLTAEKPKKNYLRHLQTAKQRLFKAFRLDPKIKWATFAIISIVVLGLGWLFKDEIWQIFSRSFKLWHLLMALGIIAVGFIPSLIKNINWLWFPRMMIEFATRFVVRGILPSLAALFVRIHLWSFDKMFLNLGKLKRLQKNIKK